MVSEGVMTWQKEVSVMPMSQPEDRPILPSDYGLSHSSSPKILNEIIKSHQLGRENIQSTKFCWEWQRFWGWWTDCNERHETSLTRHVDWRSSHPKGSLLMWYVKKKKMGVVTLPKTLFVRGKGIDQEYVEHVLLTVPNHLCVWCNSTMYAHHGQHE
jgi:hypothetical protein